MKYRILVLFAVLFTQCKMPGSLMQNSSIDLQPMEFVYDTIPPKLPMPNTHAVILIVDLCQVSQPGLLFNKQRNEVVDRVYKNFMADLQFAMQFELPNPVVVDTILKNNFSPEKLYSLMDSCQAEYGLVIPAFESGFSQDEVVREENDDGSRSKTAYYSAYCQMHLDVYQHAQLELIRDFSHSSQHSSRAVFSGLFARGPSYRKNETALQREASVAVNDIVDLFKGKIIRRTMKPE